MRAVVGVPVQELGRVLNAEVAPVLAEHGVGNDLGAVRHGGVRLGIAGKHIEILIQGLDFGITGPLQDPRLDPERFVVVGGCPAFAVGVLELVDPVNLAVSLTEGIPFLIGEERLEVGILLQVVVPRYQNTLIIQGHHGLVAVDKIRVVASGDDGTDCFRRRLSGQPGFFYLDAGFLCNEVHDLVVVVDLGGGHSCKHRELDDVPVSASSAAAGHADKHDSRKQSHCYSLPG